MLNKIQQRLQKETNSGTSTPLSAGASTSLSAGTSTTLWCKHFNFNRRKIKNTMERGLAIF
jgi:hypothetical protein